MACGCVNLAWGKTVLKNVPKREGRAEKIAAMLIIFLLLFQDTLNAPVRFVIFQYMPFYIAYIPVIICAMAVSAYLICTLEFKKARVIFIVWIIALYFIYSLSIGGSLIRIVAGLYSLSGFLIVILGPALIFEHLRKWAPFLWLISVAGILLDFATTLPWRASGGGSLNVDGTIKTISRQWEAMDGTVRLAGFGKENFSTSITITILLVFVLLDRRISKTAKLMAWILSAYTVYLTTSKTAIVVVALLLPFVAISYLIPRTQGVWGRPPFWGAVLSMCFMIILPIYCVFAQGSVQRTTEQFMFFTLDTIATRVQSEWPFAFELLRSEGSAIVYVLGRGFGGIGYGLNIEYGMPSYNFSAENLFLYLYVCFGVMAFIPFVIVMNNAVKGRASHTGELPLFLLFVIFTIGSTNTIADYPQAMFVLGALIRNNPQSKCIEQIPSSTRNGLSFAPRLKLAKSSTQEVPLRH